MKSFLYESICKGLIKSIGFSGFYNKLEKIRSKFDI